MAALRGRDGDAGIPSAEEEERRTVTSFDMAKAVEKERDNKFARRTTPAGRVRQRQVMPEILQVEDESRPATTASSIPAPPSSGEPTPANRPYAGMRDRGDIASGMDRLLPKNRLLGRRVSIADNIEKLGTSPVSPSSPESPTTMRSPLRFFRSREDKRDQLIAASAAPGENKPALVLRERVKGQTMEQMDQVRIS